LSDRSYKINNKHNSDFSIGFYRKKTIKDSNIDMAKYNPTIFNSNTESLLDSIEILKLDKMDKKKSLSYLSNLILIK